jgi:methyl-accepting chemotaxis protein
MNVKTDEERKTMRMKLKLNSKEYEKLKRYTVESGLRSMSQYMLNSIIATPIIEITDEELAPIKARVNEISDSINAIAIRVNQTGKIYHEDMEEIRQGVEEISVMLAEYRAKLESLAVTPQTFRAIVDKAHEDVKK